MANSFKPDVIVALGGGSPMDAAKIMWVMYEHPDTAFEPGHALHGHPQAYLQVPENGREGRTGLYPTTPVPVLK
jgi:alcohol dehydrogenase class IV